MTFFPQHIQSGFLEVISPPPQFYPDLTELEGTLGKPSKKLLHFHVSFWSYSGDSMDRVMWRAKQSLDFAFLMMYAKDRGTYYVQLEDDVITKNNFVSTMKKIALEKTAEKKPW